MVATFQYAGIPIHQENGVATSRLLQLSTLPPLETADWTRASYSNWQRPGPWVSDEVQSKFLAQAAGDNVPRTYDDMSSLGAPFCHLGPCETDSLFFEVAFEALAAHPLQFAQSLPAKMFAMLTWRDAWYLPDSHWMEFREDDSQPAMLKRAWNQQGDNYNGAIVWPLPMVVYSNVRDSLGLIKLLIVPALLWACLNRRWIYPGATAILLAWVFETALIHYLEARIQAPLWPLWPLLIGGMLADLWQRLSALPGARRESARPSR
ncbi:MAG: hypothetical protein OXF32_03305 [Anaerolineaceae bacterium]|nr:hypothetical protein [Anaerolineaceae bacterium]